MRKQDITHIVDIDGAHISVREIGSSRRTTGVILGIDREPDGDVYYVDRLILPPGDRVLSDEWSASGAVSTVLRRRAPTALA